MSRDLRLSLSLELDRFEQQLREAKEEISNLKTEVNISLSLDLKDARSKFLQFTKEIQDFKAKIEVDLQINKGDAQTQIEQLKSKLEQLGKKEIPLTFTQNQSGGDVSGSTDREEKKLRVRKEIAISLARARAIAVESNTIARNANQINDASLVKYSKQEGALKRQLNLLTTIKNAGGLNPKEAESLAIGLEQVNGALRILENSVAGESLSRNTKTLNEELTRASDNISKVNTQIASLKGSSDVSADQVERLKVSLASIRNEVTNAGSSFATLDSDVKKVNDSLRKIDTANVNADKLFSDASRNRARQYREEVEKIITKSKELEIAYRMQLQSDTATRESQESTFLQIKQLEEELERLTNSYRDLQGVEKNAIEGKRRLFLASDRVKNSFQSFSRTSNRANQALFEMGRGLSDAQQFTYGLQSGMIAISNNIAQSTEQFLNWRNGLKKGESMTTSLVASLTGAGGLILAVNAAALALPFIGKQIDKLTDKGERLEGSLSSLFTSFNKINDFSFDISGVSEQQEQIRIYAQTLKDLEDSFKDAENIVNKEFGISDSDSFISKLDNIVGQYFFNTAILPSETVLGRYILSKSEQNKAIKDVKATLGEFGNLDREQLTEESKNLQKKIAINEAFLERYYGEYKGTYDEITALVKSFNTNVVQEGEQGVNSRGVFRDIGDSIVEPTLQLELFRRKLKQVKSEYAEGGLSFAESGIIGILERLIGELEAELKEGTDKKVEDKLINALKADIEYYEILAGGIVGNSELDLTQLARIYEEKYSLQKQYAKEADVSEDERRNLFLSAEFEYLNNRRSIAEKQKEVNDYFIDLLNQDLPSATPLSGTLGNDSAFDQLIAKTQSSVQTLGLIREDNYKDELDRINKLYEAEIYLADITATSVGDVENKKLQATQNRINAELDLELMKYESMQNIASGYFNALSDLSQTFANINEKNAKKAFVVQKLASAGETTVNTYATIQKILAQGGLFSKPLAIAEGVAGFARVSAILSTPFGGNTGGSNSSSGGGGFQEGFSVNSPDQRDLSSNVDDNTRSIGRGGSRITVENRVKGRDLYTLVKDEEGRVLSESRRVSQDRFE